MSTRRVVMLIADIGGYTDYMQFHRSILGHAEAATTRMLDKVVDAARGFDLVEIEGDAAFLSRDADGLDGPETFNTVTRAVGALHGAFHTERRLIQLNMCPCGSCSQTNGLTLKFVAHVGEVATQTIRRRKNLVGADVILVHRLLKNPVEVPEYLLVSEELYRAGGIAASEPPMQEIAMDLGSIGQVRSHYVNVDDLAPPLSDPSWPQRIGGTFAMVGRGLPYAIGWRHRRAVSPVG
jgi:Protein of unknown function (DUF2652)